MEPHFRRATIIGAGLLGASAGLGLKARGMADHITGVGRRETSLQKAVARGAIDAASMDPGPAVKDADLVIIATPSALVIPMLDTIRPAVRPDAVITDVASTKGAICAHASATWSAPRRFIGCHPMAGSEKFGPEHARADFYEQSVCLLEDSPETDAEAAALVRALWAALGAAVFPVDAEAHDGLIARTSHVPHVLAALLADQAGEKGAAIRPFIGNGFRDMTRIAASRPEVWRDICLTNRQAIIAVLLEYRGRLDAAVELLDRGGGEALLEFFRTGRENRKKVVDL
jgi:prephenate dehydrogenase